MGVVRPDELTEVVFGSTFTEIRPDLPDNVPRLPANNGDKIGDAGAYHDIFRVKALISGLIVPVVLAEERHAV